MPLDISEQVDVIASIKWGVPYEQLIENNSHTPQIRLCAETVPSVAELMPAKKRLPGRKSFSSSELPSALQQLLEGALSFS